MLETCQHKDVFHGNMQIWDCFCLTTGGLLPDREQNACGDLDYESSQIQGFA